MCKCLTLFNEQLATDNINTQIVGHTITNLKTGHKRITVGIETQKRDPQSKEKRTLIIPTFCPFCGKAYKKEGNEKTIRSTQKKPNGLASSVTQRHRARKRTAAKTT